MLWKQERFSGVVVPAVTPVTEQGDLDVAGARRVIEHIIGGGAHPFVLGTTGEMASLTETTRARLVKTMVGVAHGRAQTFVGIGGNCLAESVNAAKRYFDLGADCAVAALPCYYPITPDHMLRFYERLADAIPGPLMLYNIPSTTHLSIPLEVVDRLGHHPRIVGLKDSENDPQRFEKGIPLWRGRDDFCHLVGTTGLCTKGLRLGSDGLVPSTGNFYPDLYVRIMDAVAGGDLDLADRLQEEQNEVSSVYQNYLRLLGRTGQILSQSIAALKFVMSELGLCGEAVLPPLLATPTDAKVVIRAEMARLNLEARCRVAKQGQRTDTFSRSRRGSAATV